MQWASSRAARGIVRQTQLHRWLASRPVTALIHGHSASPCPSQHPPSRSIFSSCCILSPPQVSLKLRPSHHTETFRYNEVVSLHHPHPPPSTQMSHGAPPHLPSPDPVKLPEYNYLNPPPDPPVQSPLSPALLSVHAARAVRHACSSGAYNDARYIINSLRFSKHPNAPRPESLNLPFLPSFEFIPITFDKPISPRVAAHALLHHMIRHESPLMAQATAQTLMTNGIQLHAATLMKVTEGVLNAPPTYFTALKEKAEFMFRLKYTLPANLVIDTQSVKDDGLRFALTLILKARENNQRSSDRAFHRVVAFCMVQGEIIMGSLLLVLLMRDYESKRQTAQQVKAKIEAQEECQGVASPALLTRWQELVLPRMPPNRILQIVVRQCEEILHEQDLEEGEARRVEALQALANLAGLIQSRSLPYSDISSLLRVLYSIPKAPDKVSVVENGKQQRINAYRYFHHVIFGLTGHLPTRRSGKDPPDKHRRKVNSHVMPPLSRETYNTLVHYALRHRLSMSLAKDILHHMEHVRMPGLKPDIATYNIFIRSGTLLRRNQMASPAFPSDPSSAYPKLPDLLAVSPSSDHTSADAFTLTSYITHLTSTGNPHAVASVLFYVLPELSIIDHPSRSDTPLTRDERARMARLTRLQRLERAISLGPWFFTSVLNALSKAGKTGLAERVWLLAKKAEKASWVVHDRQQGNVHIVQGWCLPVHAYTIMMQLYGMEARKGLRVRAGVRAPPDTRDSKGWKPHGKEKVKGWAYYVLKRDAVARGHRSRRTLGLRLGKVLYRSMMRAARDIYNSLTRLDPKANPQIYQLEPDARFFRAALDMFGRQPRMIRRASQTGRAHWKQKEGRAMLRYSRAGATPRSWNPFLKRIIQNMTEKDFELPRAFRRLFVGSWAYESLSRPRRPMSLTKNRQPFRFPIPRKNKFLPHTLDTHKDRGLPVQRDEWKRLGKRWRHWRRKRREAGRLREARKRKRLLQRT
ncbi:hypothetical protein HYDPIDRAFT_122645 [Hydnomerulius pinastri MD-312]|nr:hypothetical protein HYDPIDRAFT_122645 [Hydnomerulius pinastri MD-312]